MKALRNFILFYLLMAGLIIFSATDINAQTFTNLRSFSAQTNYLNTDGASPKRNLAMVGDTLYGTTAGGGSHSSGTIFKINTNGTGFVVLHEFAGGTNDGYNAGAAILVSGNVLYGTTQGGGINGYGTVYRINNDGTGFTILYNFTPVSGQTLSNNDGAIPTEGLAIIGDVLFGTAYYGGPAGAGTIFKVNTDGTGFATIHQFTGTDGSRPDGPLIFLGTNLFGTAYGGGNGQGVLFAIHTDGSGFSVLHIFNSTTDGALPGCTLIPSASSNILYGATPAGGALNGGTIFSISTDGSHFTNLYNLDNINPVGGYQGGLLLSGSTLYGVVAASASSSNGIIFSINTNGTGYTNLYTFGATTNSASLSGASPAGPLALSSNNMVYGVTVNGGTGDSGTIFAFSLPSQTVAHPLFFSGEASLGNDVYYLAFQNGNIFGYYNYDFFPYLYHYDLGFEYFIDANDSVHGAYLYDFTSGHFWYTSPAYPFPYLYDFTLNAVLYCYPDTTKPGHYDTNPRYFYNTATSNIFSQ